MMSYELYLTLWIIGRQGIEITDLVMIFNDSLDLDLLMICYERYQAAQKSTLLLV